jgi:hypothetical protein
MLCAVTGLVSFSLRKSGEEESVGPPGRCGGVVDMMLRGRAQGGGEASTLFSSLARRALARRARRRRRARGCSLCRHNRPGNQTLPPRALCLGEAGARVRRSRAIGWWGEGLARARAREAGACRGWGEEEGQKEGEWNAGGRGEVPAPAIHALAPGKPASQSALSTRRLVSHARVPPTKTERGPPRPRPKRKRESISRRFLVPAKRTCARRLFSPTIHKPSTLTSPRAVLRARRRSPPSASTPRWRTKTRSSR